jgi:GAF domain-containing protein
MAERLEEVNRLYQAMSHEGWKTYRETAELPEGFIYDKAGIRPVDDEVLAGELFSDIQMKVLGGEVVGTLTIANDPQNPISPEDYIFLQQVSDQVALALESARLTAQTQSALAQTERLSQASLQLTRANNLQELLQVTVQTLEISSINRGIICSLAYTPEGKIKDMTVIANWWNGKGQKATEVGTQYTKEKLEVISLFLSSTPIFFDDAFNDERIDEASMMVVQAKNIRTVAGLPLYTGETQIGVILLEGEEPHIFSKDEIRLFTAMGPQIATVLENRRQFERAQRQAEREAMLNAISQKIQSATSVEAVLQIAARELGHALGSPRTIAQLSLKDK